MFNRNIFIKNFISLRNSHDLSSGDLTFLLNQKSRSSITNIESGRALPSFEKLIEIANLFTISIDWLVGRSSEPYNEEIILNIEREILSISYTSNNVSFRLLRSPLIPEEYLNETTRKKLYSLPVRANLIFLLRFKIIQIKTALENTIGLQIDDIPNNSSELFSILETYYCDNNKKRFNEVNNLYLQNLNLLLSRQQTTPVFDITQIHS